LKFHEVFHAPYNHLLLPSGIIISFAVPGMFSFLFYLIFTI
jgi:hypothetical protein